MTYTLSKPHGSQSARTLFILLIIYLRIFLLYITIVYCNLHCIYVSQCFHASTITEASVKWVQLVKLDITKLLTSKCIRSLSTSTSYSLCPYEWGVNKLFLLPSLYLPIVTTNNRHCECWVLLLRIVGCATCSARLRNSFLDKVIMNTLKRGKREGLWWSDSTYLLVIQVLYLCIVCKQCKALIVSET